MYNQIEKLASAIRNDVVSGLRGYYNNLSMSMEQLEQDIVDERLLILKEYQLKGILPTKDLYISINCIPVDCKSINKCSCGGNLDQPMLHFEIPQILNDYGTAAIDYLGSADQQFPFIYYRSPNDIQEKILNNVQILKKNNGVKYGKIVNTTVENGGTNVRK